MKTLIALTVAASAFVSPLGAMERPFADNDNMPTVSITKPKFPKRVCFLTGTD